MIRRLPPTVIGLAFVFAVAACGGSSSSSNPAGERVGSLGDAIEVAAAAPAQADAAACRLDRATIEAAVEMYATLNGADPTSEDDLVEEQLIREPSALHDVSPDGHVVAAPGTGCP